MANYIDKTLRDINRILRDSLIFEEKKNSFLSKLDERIKILSLFIILITISFINKLETLIFLYFLSILIGYKNKIKIRELLRRTWIFIPLFTLFIAIPSIFLQNLYTALRLVLRTAVSISYVQILILTTSWTRIFLGLRGIKFPPFLISILSLTYRYIFLLLEIAENLFLAKKSRTIEFKRKREQIFIGNSIGIMLIKTHNLSYEVYQGMISRGFSDESFFYRNIKINIYDILFLLLTILFSVSIIFMERL
jgi:cobalt/nickel transport system permease protein